MPAMNEKATRKEKAVLRREIDRGRDQARAGKISGRSVTDIAAAVRRRVRKKT